MGPSQASRSAPAVTTAAASSLPTSSRRRWTTSPLRRWAQPPTMRPSTQIVGPALPLRSKSVGPADGAGPGLALPDRDLMIQRRDGLGHLGARRLPSGDQLGQGGSLGRRQPGGAVGGDAGLLDHLHRPASLAGDEGLGHRRLHGRHEVDGHHEHRAPHAQRADEAAVHVERILQGRHRSRRFPQPCPGAEEDGGRVGAVEADDVGGHGDDVGRPGRPGQVVAPGETGCGAGDRRGGEGSRPFVRFFQVRADGRTGIPPTGPWPVPEQRRSGLFFRRYPMPAASFRRAAGALAALITLGAASLLTPGPAAAAVADSSVSVTDPSGDAVRGGATSGEPAGRHRRRRRPLPERLHQPDDEAGQGRRPVRHVGRTTTCAGPSDPGELLARLHGPAEAGRQRLRSGRRVRARRGRDSLPQRHRQLRRGQRPVPRQHPGRAASVRPHPSNGPPSGA